MTVQPFTIAIPQQTLDDLRDRLVRTRWPDEVANAGWDYGTNRAYLRQLMDYWQRGFDWRAQEARLNAFPQFRATVDGISIHFIHARGTGPNPMPLLMLHGWPSSFVQMLKIIPLLADPGAHGGDPADSFDVITASLPGYGFSDRPIARGMSVARTADLFHMLMTEELGYARYAVRGSDLGAGVISQMALAHPEMVIGLHTGGTNPYIGQVPDDLTEEERQFVTNAQQWMQTEMAYAMEHSSKPQTLAYALNDSPAGMAAWIIEKFRRWSDCDGDLESVFTKDELLTNLTIYWVTETINSSMRLYYETVRDPGRRGQVSVPTASAMPPHDMFPTPRSWVERGGRLNRWTVLPKGGHFPEWEVPGPLAEDMRAFFRPLR